MSSWGVGISFSKLHYVRVFLKNRVKSVGFQMVIWNKKSFGGGGGCQEPTFESTKQPQSPFGVQRHKPYEEAKGRASAKRELSS